MNFDYKFNRSGFRRSLCFFVTVVEGRDSGVEFVQVVEVEDSEVVGDNWVDGETVVNCVEVFVYSHVFAVLTVLV